jgi:hypothetical protein
LAHLLIPCAILEVELKTNFGAPSRAQPYPKGPYRIVWTPFVFKNLAIDPGGRVERMETIQKSPTKTQKGTARAVPFADLGRTRILWDRVGLKSKQEIEENPEAQLDSRN